jgi:hypothetical protein
MTLPNVMTFLRMRTSLSLPYGRKIFNLPPGNMDLNGEMVWRKRRLPKVAVERCFLLSKSVAIGLLVVAICHN